MKFVRRLALVVPAILLMGLPPAAWSQQRNAPKVPPETRTAAQIQAVTEFSFEGVSLGMSLEAFLVKYPAAEQHEEESNPKVGLKSYRVQKLETADSARFLFLDDMLFQMTSFYTPERLREMGGDTIPLRKLVQKFGKQDKNSPGITRQKGEETFTAKWDFPQQSRCVRFIAAQQVSYISIVDTGRSGQASKRVTDQADLGF